MYLYNSRSDGDRIFFHAIYLWEDWKTSTEIVNILSDETDYMYTVLRAL